MFEFGAQKGKWSMNADFIYMNLGAKEEISGEIIGQPGTLEADIDLRAVISTVHGVIRSSSMTKINWMS